MAAFKWHEPGIIPQPPCPYWRSTPRRQQPNRTPAGFAIRQAAQELAAKGQDVTAIINALLKIGERDYHAAVADLVGGQKSSLQQIDSVLKHTSRSLAVPA